VSEDESEDESAVAPFRDARSRVLERIAEAAIRVGRDPGEVTLVAVSKTVPIVRLRAAVAAGLDVLGENRVQEGVAKAPTVPGARWHLVGPLQANKARRAIETFAVIETVDSVELAERLGRLAAELGRSRYPVLLQVNVDRDPAKAGFDPASLEAALDALIAPGLEILGLMTVGRAVERASEARRTFAALRELSGHVRARHPRLGPALSMGMSDDYVEAVEEGATIVRVGRALFGERPHAHPHPPSHSHSDGG
jgi:pyridoxal phosphate enzyme (YggS family)